MKFFKNKISRIIYFFAIFYCSFILFEETLAQESVGAAGTFLRLGVGARALGMGGAFVGIADDPSATFWNPAGLYQIRNYQFEFMYMNMPFDRMFNFFSTVIPVKRFITVGVSWIGLRVDNLEGRNFNSAEPDYFFTNSQNAFFLSFGKSLSPLLSMGGSVKIIHTTLDNNNATGLGFDGSLLLRPIDQLSLGMVIQDIGTDIRWNGGFTEGVPITLRFGAAWRVYKNILISAEVQKTSRVSPEIHIGGEVRLLETVPIRIGLNDRQITGGAGLVLPFANHTLAFNYGYSNDKLVNDAVHRVSVIFSFGNKSSRKKIGENKPLDVWDSEKTEKNKVKNFDKGKFRVIVKAKVLNVRSGPGRKYRKIAQILKDQKFEAFERKGNWRRIKLTNGKMGWVHEKYVERIKTN
ncbi:MAG: PorV/PorQ family protein [bacterium]